MNILKRCRKESPMTQEDVATLLGIDQGNLARFETEKRTPTSEILLAYHILFGATLTELLHPLYKKVKNTILRRSEKLIPKLIVAEPPKSKQRVAYLNNIVKKLNDIQEHDE